MSDPGTAILTAGAAALATNADVIALAAATREGPAVFAPHQDFPDGYPRVTLQLPQVLPTADDGACGQGSLVYFTIDVWAQGPDAQVDAGALAAACRRVLSARLDLGPDLKVTSYGFESSRPVGDPDPLIEHVVSVFRFTVRPKA